MKGALSSSFAHAFAWVSKLKKTSFYWMNKMDLDVSQIIRIGLDGMSL